MTLDVHEHCATRGAVTEFDPIEARREVASAAKAFLAGEASVIETARRIHDLLGGSDMPGWPNDPDYRTIANIADQSNGLPVGRVREFWAPDALVARDLSISQIETANRHDLEIACRNLLIRYPDIQLP